MKRCILLLSVGLFLGVSAFAQAPFSLAGSEKKTLKYAELTKLKNEQTMGKKDGTTLTFKEAEVRLVVTSGPEDDMLSYRIQGVRNPTLVVPSGATLRILFANTDDDMKHDLLFGDLKAPFELTPDAKNSVGTSRLDPQGEDETLAGEEITIKAGANGRFTYFCSVPGHAKGGMWGNIVVGTKAGPNMTMPQKTAHVHSPDEMKGSPGGGAEMPGMPQNDTGMDMKMKMRSVTDRNDPMAREGSGTAWLPDSSPMYGYMKMSEGNGVGGMLMLHGSAFLRYTEVGGERDVSVAGKGGRARFDAPSMLMVMYSRPISDKAQFGLRAMVSLDPAVERGYGYPLLYQSGESFRGVLLHDRQHPHDLIDELAATYSYSFNEKNSFYLYAGAAGEPALGPPNFMHRLSGMDNPDAPTSHHWQDSTHVSYGVVTAGYNFGKVKFEASAFNGREPDENRWAIDKLRLNSFSGRISWNPTKDLSLQISHGYLKEPEVLEPDVHMLRRTTASAIYNKNFSENQNWASSFIYGQNYANGERTNSFLFESNYSFYRNSIFGRAERVQKPGHDLVLDPIDEDKIFWVSAVSLGYIYDVVQGKGIDVGLGSGVTFSQNPDTLSSYYGGTNHQGFQFFIRLRPSKITIH